jgi:tetratricopeptide (TPR) repeat protein
MEDNVKALAIRLKQLDDEHVDVSDSYINMADVYVSLADYSAAKEYYEKSLAIRIRITVWNTYS